ncbi:Gfo/Idh/MocA family protein [Halostagnicola kamekurae]|uniref:Predicted dehydrogenase n=1 Tax=Halostagnicola kamekurae TaxID=619731 RepID=A0A1I6TKL2_9EURY|nr:Gfo/Idh/MocA family oxidoreductase [Halostagnicola kamekurae]SFS89759.1 Predicted dehydrogenase [Halostagnicola kamekurae]
MNTHFTQIRTGIVGLGNIGEHHAQRLEELDVSLVGGMDVAAPAREEFANRHDAAVYEDHQRLYDDCDAVIITTPNKFHEEYAVDALEAGLHVLLEKPLAHSLESAERIAAAAADADGNCTIGFNNRFLNAVEVIESRLDEGELGEITHVEANYVRRRGIPGRGSWFTNEAVSGGGSLIDLGVHAIDLALYLLGYPRVDAVSGVTRSEFGGRSDYAYLQMWGDDVGPDGFDVDDSTSAFIRCAGNRTISLETAWATNRPPTHEFVVRGTEAAACFDLLENDLSFYSVRSDGVDQFEDTAIQTPENDTHADEQEAFFDAIAAGEPVEDNVEQALTVQRVIDAIYRSSESGLPVTLTEPETATRAEPPSQRR